MKTSLITLTLFTCHLLSTSALAADPNAVYEVPGDGVAERALYQMPPVNINSNGDDIRITYDLPLELTGAKNKIRASGKILSQTQALLKGPKSDMDCDLQIKKCSVQYHDLNIDMKLVAKNLQKLNLSKDNFQKQMLISEHFARDPIGILHLDGE